MGDIADDLIDRLYDDDWYPSDEDQEGPWDDDRTCRVCGKGRLRWGREGNRWRLFDMNKREQHECPGIDPTKFFPNLESK